MNQQASQPAVKVDLRKHMPETAKWVDQKRKELGTEFVNGCIRRAMKGEAGLFYAFERGYVLGTPFPLTSEVAKDQEYAVTMGCTFAGFLAKPGGSNGTH